MPACPPARPAACAWGAPPVRGRCHVLVRLTRCRDSTAAAPGAPRTPQGRVTDHRVGVTLHDMEAVMAGEALDEFLEPLELQQQVQLLEDLEATG